MDWTPVSSPPSPAAEGHVMLFESGHVSSRHGNGENESSYLPRLLQHRSTRILGVSLEPGLGPRGVDTLGQAPSDVTSLQPAKLSEILKILN